MHTPEEHPQPALVQTGTQANAKARHRPGLELLVVIAFGVLPHLTNAIMPMLYMQGENGAEYATATQAGFSILWLPHLVISLANIAAVLWIMRQAPEPWSFFGFRTPRPIADPLIGVGLYALNYAAYMALGTVLASALWYAGIDLSSETPFESGALAAPGGPLDLPMMIAVSIANASAEQLVITAYLISRVRQIGEHAAIAVLVAVLFFASYHIYQGPWGVFNALLFGTLLGTFYCITGRIWPCIAAHILGDAVPFLLAYLFA